MLFTYKNSLEEIIMIRELIDMELEAVAGGLRGDGVPAGGRGGPVVPAPLPTLPSISLSQTNDGSPTASAGFGPFVGFF